MKLDLCRRAGTCGRAARRQAGWAVSCCVHLLGAAFLLWGTIHWSLARTDSLTVPDRAYGPHPEFRARFSAWSHAPKVEHRPTSDTAWFLQTDGPDVRVLPDAPSTDFGTGSPDAICDAMNETGTAPALGTGGGFTGRFSQEPGSGMPITHMLEANGGAPGLGEGGGRAQEALRSRERAWAWLCAHQEPDGRWDSVKFGSSARCDTACTALALSALAAPGLRGVREDRAIMRASAWLLRQQNAAGRVYAAGDACSPAYSHALAGIALADAACLELPIDRAAVQRAVDYTCACQEVSERELSSGWGYEPGGPTNLAITFWHARHLERAARARLEVPDAAVVCAGAYAREMAPARGGAPCYALRQPAGLYSSSASLTLHWLVLCKALDVDVTSVTRHPPLDPKRMEEALARDLEPAWGAGCERADLYQWFLLTLAQPTGVSALKARQCLVEHQGADGSFEPAGLFSSTWGRVGQTALATLILR